MSCRSGPGPDPFNRPESIGEPIPDLDRAHGCHSCGSQLDAQREPVEGLADLGHRGRRFAVPESEVGPDGPGPIDEQRDGVGGHAPVQRQRRHGEHRLAVDREGLARRGDDLDAPGPTEDRRDGRTRRGEDVLAVVHHQQEPPASPSASATVSMSAASPCGVMPSTVAIGGRDGGRVADRRQLDHPHAVGELAGHLGPDFERPAGSCRPLRRRSA